MAECIPDKASTESAADSIALNVMDEFEKGLYSFFEKEYAELTAQLKTGKKADKELLGAIREALGEYVKRV